MTNDRSIDKIGPIPIKKQPSYFLYGYINNPKIKTLKFLNV